MIDTLQRFALRIRPLRHVAVALAVVCLVGLAMILFVAPASGDSNRFLVPALVGLVWCVSAYGFIDTFQSVPVAIDESHGLFARAKRALARAWYWLLALVFAASTAAALLLTFKLASVWLDRY